MANSRWPIFQLGDVAEDLTVGFVGTMASEYVALGVPFLRSQNIEPFRLNFKDIKYIGSQFHTKIAKSSLCAGDVVIVRTGKPGTAAVIPPDLGELNCSDLVIVRPGSRLNSRFLCYYVNGVAQHHVDANLVGAVQQHFNVGAARQLPLPLPPLEEQRAIAHILGTLDDKIELNRRMNETLEAMARALFKSWFVDFDPVRAKAERRTPSGMDAETAKLFPSEFVDSEMGAIPKGWSLAPLADYVVALSGGTPSKGNASLWGGDIPWISPKVMTSLHADETDSFVTPAAVGNGTRIAPAGSTLVMVRGMGLHKEVRVSQARHDVTFNQDVKALVPKGIEPSLLLFALLDAQEVLLGRVESSGHGTGVLPSETLLGYSMVMPDAAVQRHLAAHFDVINDRIAAVRGETKTLAALRDGLLPRLLSGELHVSHSAATLQKAT